MGVFNSREKSYLNRVTRHTEASLVPKKQICQYTQVLPAKKHCNDGPPGSFIWCYLGQPTKLYRQIYFLGTRLASVYLVDGKNGHYMLQYYFRRLLQCLNAVKYIVIISLFQDIFGNCAVWCKRNVALSAHAYKLHTSQPRGLVCVSMTTLKQKSH